MISQHALVAQSTSRKHDTSCAAVTLPICIGYMETGLGDEGYFNSETSGQGQPPPVNPAFHKSCVPSTCSSVISSILNFNLSLHKQSWTSFHQHTFRCLVAEIAIVQFKSIDAREDIQMQ